MGPIGPHHIACLRAVQEKRATVGADGFAIDGKALDGDIEVAMGGLWLGGLVAGFTAMTVPTPMWPTKAGERELATNDQSEEIR